jgi:TRAP-type uncharacterized transport system substrate-binding protein
MAAEMGSTNPRPRRRGGRWTGAGLFSASTLLVIAGFLVAWQFVQPAPPRTLSIATGSRDGAYYGFAEQYRAILARSGIELRVIETGGSVENLERLLDPTDPVDLGFVQGGVASESQRRQLSGLGSLFYEPLWLIGPAGAANVPLNALAGARIAVGPEASGTRFLALHLLAANGIGADNATLISEGLSDSITGLREGRLDLVFTVAAPEAPALERLAETGSGRLLDLPRAAAYTRRDRALTALTLPMGTLDLVRNTPDQDLSLLAATANLVARPSLHPALVGLLISTADRIHGGGGLFAPRGAFPSPRYSDFPLHPDAERHYEHGPPFLQRYLPFWAASWVDRLEVMLLPLIGLLLPLVKLLPPIYRWRIRRRIFRWYLQLRRVDLEMETTPMTRQTIDTLRKRVEEIESKAAVTELPLHYTDQLYHLRLHIQLLQRKLDRLKATG